MKKSLCPAPPRLFFRAETAADLMTPNPIMDTVAAFSFEEREKSYAHLVGRPENIGVIGLIAIEELAPRPRSLAEKRYAAPSLAQRDQGTVGGTGTGYGRDIDSRIYYVPFVRSGNKRAVTFYYDTVEALRRAGIPVERQSAVPFPADTEFAPPPPGHKEVRTP